MRWLFRCVRSWFRPCEAIYSESRGRWADGSFRPVLWDDGESVQTLARRTRLTKV